MQSCRCFLFRACSGDSNTDTLREEVFKTLSYSDVEALDLVKQCRLLELPYSTNFTSEVLSNSAASLKGLKKRIIEEDRSYQLKQALNHPSQKLVTRVAIYGCWLTESLGRGTGPRSHRHLGLTLHPQAAMQNCVCQQKMSCGTMQ